MAAAAMPNVSKRIQHKKKKKIVAQNVATCAQLKQNMTKCRGFVPLL